MRGSQFAMYELYSCTDVYMYSSICVYIAEYALYMYVHILTNPLTDNVIFEQTQADVNIAFLISLRDSETWKTIATLIFIMQLL